MSGRGILMVKLAMEAAVEVNNYQESKAVTENQDNNNNLGVNSLQCRHNKDDDKVVIPENDVGDVNEAGKDKELMTLGNITNNDCIISELLPVELEIDRNLYDIDLTNITTVATQFESEVLNIINLDNNLMILQDNDNDNIPLEIENDYINKKEEIRDKESENLDHLDKENEHQHVEIDHQHVEIDHQHVDIDYQEEENNHQDSVNKDDLDDNFTTVKTRQKLQTKLRRVEGRSYIGYKVLNKKVSQSVRKEKRKIKERCNHIMTDKKSDRSFCCGMITANDREKIFAKFWAMKTWSEKQGYVKGLVNTRGVKRRRKKQQDTDEHKKNLGHDIFLDSENGQRHKVCRTFFINTLGIGEDCFKRWTKSIPSSTPVTSEDEDNMSDPTPILPKTSRQKKKENDINNIITWLNLLPKIPSHYCRQSSQKLYVESVFHSKRHMHSVYEQWCKENNIKPAIRTIFCNTLEDEKIAIHKPRKDQCDICISYKEGHLSKEAYDNHIERKNQAREEKNKEKQSASDTKKVLTMDLQSKLLCPISLASSMYYKQKLTVHNFTLRELNDGQVRLYVWHEVDGGVGANEFSSCLVDYILELPDSFKHVVLISDGCCSQNRNKILSTALSDTARQKNIIIEQLYLQRGHTMMEADNVHATLEHYFKPPIYSPTDYISRMHLARPEKPYEIKVVHYDFFKNYSKMDSVLPSIRPGIGTGEKCVTDICKIKYFPDGSINIKTDFNEDWKTLPHRRQKIVECFKGLKDLYTNEIPLKESKYKDLQSLKSIIDRQYHDFYDKLPFKQENKKDLTKNDDIEQKKKKRKK